MSLMLIRRGIEALVGTALVVVAMVAVLPAAAEAQSIATSQEAQDAADANPTARMVVVVEPGDSLWSISAERLGPGATSQQIAKGVEQIYALNRDQIGPDPSLIFVGQRLSLPAAMGSREVAHANAKTTTASPAAREGTGTAAAASPKKTGYAVSATETEPIQASRPAPRTPEAGLAAKAEKAPTPVGETPSLPNAPEAVAAVPAVRHAASEDSPTTPPLTPLLRNVRSVVVSAASELGEILTEVRAAAARELRATLGWVIVAFTVVVGVLMAWRLPMKRTTRWDAQRWGMPSGYGTSLYPFHSGERPPHESPARVAPAASGPSRTNGSKDKAQERKRRLTEASEQRSDELAERGR